jgi:hypothetical protein
MDGNGFAANERQENDVTAMERYDNGAADAGKHGRSIGTGPVVVLTAALLALGGSALYTARNYVFLYDDTLVTYDSEFDKGFADYSPSRVVQDGPRAEFRDGAEALKVDGLSVVQFASEHSIFTRALIPVNPRRKYELSARMRVTRKDPIFGGSTTYVGLVMYDATGREIAASSGGYRYAAANAVKLSEEQGWIVLSGIVQGQGDTPHTFMRGTAFVRPVIIANQGTPEAVSQIDKLQFGPADTE